MDIRTLLTNFYYKTAIGSIILKPLIGFRDFLIPLEKRLKSRFRRILGRSLDLENPKSLNEKIQWLKLNDRSELHVICADKYKVRDYVEKKIGKEYLIPLILETKNVSDLNPQKITDSQFIIKTNHDSGGVQIVRDKSAINWTDIRKKFNKIQSNEYGTSKGEWQYQKIEPRILVEKLLLDKNGEIPSDFKFHVMNAKVKMIQVDLDRATEHKRNLYGPEWNLLPCEWDKVRNGIVQERPVMLQEMIHLAEILAEDFIYVRVDFYNIEKEIYFGELTFHPGSGFIKFIPDKCDFEFGKLLKLPTDTTP